LEEKLRKEKEEQQKQKRLSKSVSPKAQENDSEGKKKVNWIEDTERTNCKICGAGFSFMNRRHHCRACGEIICSNCCSKSNSKDRELWCKTCLQAPPNTYAHPS